MTRVPALLLCLCALAPAFAPQTAFTDAGARAIIAPAGGSVLHYGAEWRMMRAGEARLALTAPSESLGRYQADLELRTTGVVASLYKVDNTYSALFDEQFCAGSTLMLTRESKKRRETRVTFNQPPGKASYLERDLVKDEIVSTRDIDVPPCVHDVLAGLVRLRALAPEPGQTVQWPLSDGKKSVLARITAMRRETVKTHAGEHRTLRYEAFLFNDVLYRRKGRLFVWLTDDARRLPVQIRIQLPFYLGTITLKLEKEEPS